MPYRRVNDIFLSYVVGTPVQKYHIPYLLEKAPRRLFNFSRHKYGAYLRAALIRGTEAAFI